MNIVCGSYVLFIYSLYVLIFEVRSTSRIRVFPLPSHCPHPQCPTNMRLRVRLRVRPAGALRVRLCVRLRVRTNDHYQ